MSLIYYDFFKTKQTITENIFFFFFTKVKIFLFPFCNQAATESWKSENYIKTVTVTWILSGTPVLSMRLATFTVFPQMSYWGFLAPITPATTGPMFRPMEGDWREMSQRSHFTKKWKKKEGAAFIPRSNLTLWVCPGLICSCDSSQNYRAAFGCTPIFILKLLKECSLMILIWSIILMA